MVEISELAKEFVEFFDCEYEYFPKNTYEEIMEEFEKCVEEGKEKGYFPVIVTVDETLLESLAFNVSDDEEFSIEDVRKYREKYISSIYSEGGKNILRDLINIRKEEAEEDDMDWYEEILGEFEDSGEDRLNSPIGFLDFETEKPIELFIVKVPVKNPWEIFAWLPMGNWNDCPTTSEHMAISRYWFEKYGAVPISMIHDVVEYRVEKVIKTEDEAMEVAVEMYGYCPDVDQSYDTLGLLAGSLVDSSVWYFWWGAYMLDKKELEPLKRNAIVINYNEENSEKIPKGSSKIGGKPDLPKNFQWYYYNGEDYKKRVANRPLSFLMQINCEEVHKYDKESLLPEKGILYFFYELLTMTWGFSPNDRGSTRVFYYDGEIEDLVSTDFPEDMEKDCIIPEAKIDFESMNDYPIDFFDYYDDEDSDEEIRRKEKEIEKDLDELGYKTDTTKLLGHPELIQEEYWEECEGVARKNLDYGSAPIKYGDLKNEIKENAKDWILLMQMSEFEFEDYGLYFGDSGKIYFNIRKEDLKNRNFDNVWLILQCY